MNTEITDERAERGWVLYDGGCNICKRFVRTLGPALKRRGFGCVPLQTDWVRERLNLPENELMLEMRVLERSGKVRGGAAGVLLLARTFWWGLPLVLLANIPGMFGILDRAYRWGAARRYCENGSCRVERRLRRGWWALLLLLPVLLLFVRGDLAPWVFMWAMAGALWFALKLFTLMDARGRALGRLLAYLFAWPGMDTSEFFGQGAPKRPGLCDWLFGGLNISIGAALIYGGVRVAMPHSELLAGWLGMTGIVLVLHFGLFKWLALLWRTFGIPATPVMDAPLGSRSLSEFWGRRWNTGFSIPARRYLMEPLARRFGTAAGLFAVFLVSGLVHELVISVPARAGYGLPTLYFMIQAAALVLERKHGANRLLTLACVGVPALILFHPPFVHHVIIPFLNTIGAL